MYSKIVVFPEHWKSFQSNTITTLGKAMVDSDIEEEQEDESSALDYLSKVLLKLDNQFIISLQPQNLSADFGSMVIIKDYQESSIVFPPAHHENLHLKPSIFTEDIQKKHYCESFTPSLSSSSSTTTVSTLSADSEDDSSSALLSPMGCDVRAGLTSTDLNLKQVRKPAAVVMEWVYYGVELLIRKVKGVLRSFPSLSKAFFTAAVVLGYLYFRHRRRMVVREENREHFDQIIREKDERIRQLLNQIVRMNEVMLALPRNSTIKN